MIKEKEISVCISSSCLIPHYRNIGYNVNFKDTITIPIEHLPKGSHTEITAICDKCGKEKKMMYKTYNVSVGDTYYCIKCSKEKKNKTMKEKYGFEHALQCKEFKKKCQETWLDNYGVNHPMKDENVRNSQHKTMLDLYGTEHALCNEDILNKMLNKQLEKYGMLFFKSDEFKEKNEITCLEKYNVKSILLNEDIKLKRDNTMLEKYGVLYSGQNKEILEKILKSSKKINKYKDTELYYQGSYEKDFLEFCENLNILDKIKRGFTIKYEMEGEILIYFPDFFIEEINLIVEIKSSYWYKVHEKRNIQKEINCKELNYEYVMIMDKNYSEFIKLIKSLLS